LGADFKNSRHQDRRLVPVNRQFYELMSYH
jgi:hypothetical protein